MTTEKNTAQQQSQPKLKLAIQFRAQVALPNLECTITGKTPTEVQSAISKLFSNRVSFEQTGETSVLVYHTEHGSVPVGSINEMQVPEGWDVATRIEQRFGVQRAA